MPWSPDDAKRHTKKATTPAKKRQFAAAANNARSSALAEGKDESEADAVGVRVGNAAVKNHPSKKRK